MRYFCLFLVVIALFWCFFATDQNFVFEYAVHNTAAIIQHNPLDILSNVGNNIVTDANNMVKGFSRLSDYDNILDWLKGFGNSFVMFFRNLGYLVIDVFLAPFQFILQIIVDFYNLLSIWLGFPYISIEVPQFYRS